MRIFALLTRAASGSYLDLKMSEVIRFEYTPHPVEFEMYYSA
jgi:glutamine synthetase